jgi:putative DNA primase/helicase
MSELKYTLWTSNKGTRCKQPVATWPRFCEQLQAIPPAQVKDDCKLIKLATFGDHRTDKGSLRHDANVLTVTGIEGDYDSEEMTPEKAVELLESCNLRAAIAPTFSSTPDAPRWRVLTPLAEPIKPSERLRYIEILNGMLGGVLAAESATLSQSYYVGVPAGADYNVLLTFGDPEQGCTLDELDIMHDLDQYRTPLRAKKGSDGKDGKGNNLDDTTFDDWVQQLVEADPIHQALTRIAGHCVAKGFDDQHIRMLFVGLADRVREKRGDERADLMLGKELDDAISSARAKGWEPEKYDDLLSEAQAMDSDTAPDKIEALTKRTLKLSPVEQEKVLKAIRKQTSVNISSLRDLVKAESREVKKKIVEKKAKGFQPMMLEYFPDLAFNEETGAMKVVSTLPNIAALMDHYGIKASYDVISKKTQLIVPGMNGSPDNADNSALTWVISLAKLNEIPSEMVPAYVETVADDRQVNPVADWVMSREWDGVDRLREICNTLELAPGYPEKLRDTLVFRWLVSAIAAAIKPMGFKARGVLTLQGPQSIGKTSWLESLVPDVQLRERLVKVDHLLDPSNKDSILGAITHWLVELGELDGSFRKADVSRIKGFLTAPVDKVRRPYARVEAEYQRRTVFFASVNDAHFLVDETGNTRFWTIPVKSVNFKHGIDMQQLWRQVAELYKAGHQWWLTREEEAQLEQINKGHRVASSVRELIVSRLNFDADTSRWEKRTASEVLIQIGYDRPTNPQCREAGSVLRELLGEPKMSKGVGRWLAPPVKVVGDPTIRDDFDDQTAAGW